MPDLPIILEDRSGLYHSSDFDDIYDRLFLRVASSPDHISMIYNMGKRSSHKPDSRHFEKIPSVLLDLSSASGLGTIHFIHPPNKPFSFPIHRYLRRTAIFGGSLSRKFRGSDGQEYRWSYRSVKGQEWTCVTSDDHLVAHYALKAPEVPAFHVSGNVLTLHQGFSHLAIELLASLTIMRHIAEHNL